MADPNLIDESQVPAGEQFFRAPPHFVVDELVRTATAELQAGNAELTKQRESLSDLVREAVRAEIEPLLTALRAAQKV
jgi:hypothetical protein